MDNILSTIGSNKPTATMRLKYKTANIIIENVDVTPLIPANANSKVSIPNPPIRPKISGTAMIETSGLTFFEDITIRKTPTVRYPNNANDILHTLLILLNLLCDVILF